jgi:hypothetical protein
MDGEGRKSGDEEGWMMEADRDEEREEEASGIERKGLGVR